MSHETVREALNTLEKFLLPPGSSEESSDDHNAQNSAEPLKEEKPEVSWTENTPRDAKLEHESSKKENQSNERRPDLIQDKAKLLKQSFPNEQEKIKTENAAQKDNLPAEIASQLKIKEKEEAKKESPGEITTPSCPREDTPKPDQQPNEVQVSSTGGKS